jgi:hypothetical protein
MPTCHKITNRVDGPELYESTTNHHKDVRVLLGRTEQEIDKIIWRSKWSFPAKESSLPSL